MGSGITKFTKMAPEGDVRLVFSRADKVVGELAVEGRHCDAQGVVTVGTLFSLSQALCEVAIAARFGAEAQATAHEAKTIALNPVRTNFLNGEAVQLPAPEGLSTWQITIRREDGEVTAILSQGFVMSKTTTEQNQPAEAVIQTGLARPAPIQMLPSDKRINALVAAGTEVIARKGFAGATIREIAEQAGVHTVVSNPVAAEHFRNCQYGLMFIAKMPSACSECLVEAMLLRFFGYLFLAASFLFLIAMFYFEVEFVPILLGAGLASILAGVLLHSAQEGLDLLKEIRDGLRSAK